jgi:hypothetical protein
MVDASPDPGVHRPPPTREVVVFATGYDGPIDNGDDWRYFHLNQTTLIVSMGGGVPSGLVTAAHTHGSMVSRAAVLDVDATDLAAVQQWVDAEVAAVESSHADGTTIIRITQPEGTAPTAVTAVVGQLRERLAGKHLSLVLPLNRTQGTGTNHAVHRDAATNGIDPAALAEQVDFVILTALLDPVGPAACAPGGVGLPRTPEPNVAIGVLGDVAVASGIPPNKVVVALPWFGWDYRCGDPECTTVLPPRGTRACWRGWNLQRSVAYIEGTLAATSGATAKVDAKTGTAVLRYNDSTGVGHVVSYDTPATLTAKYAACRKYRGVGVWTADMVSYVGDPAAQALAAAMWGSIDADTDAGPATDDSRGGPPGGPPQTAKRAVLGQAGQTRIDRLAARFRRRHGLSAGSHIPGYDPCRRQPPRPDQPATDTGCSDGLLCISPEPTPSTAEHESGGCYPVRPGLTSFVARTRVPPIPPTFRPEQATVYYYLNLVMPDDGNSDVTNSTTGYARSHFRHQTAVFFC